LFARRRECLAHEFFVRERPIYAAAKNDEERFVLDYFLKSSVRDGEAAHAARLKPPGK
jgi:hypothetical protein